MTFIKKFEALNKKYGKIDESKLTENFAVQIELTDDDCGGIFYVAYANGKPFEVQPYDYHDNTASVKVSSKVLENILSCKADAVAQYQEGKIAIEGNLCHALMIVDLMKKEPVKRVRKTTKTETVTEEKPAKAEIAAEEKPAEKKSTETKPVDEKPAKKKTTKKAK